MKVELTVGEARAEPSRTCANGHRFTVDASRYERAAVDLRRQVDDMLG